MIYLVLSNSLCSFATRQTYITDTELLRLDLCRRLRPPNSLNIFMVHWLKGTCEWSTRHPIIGKWLHSDTVETARLWLHGGPGTGKSMLAAYLIEQKKIERSQDEVILYAFCKAQGTVKATSTSIVLSFLRQCVDDHWDRLEWKIIHDLRRTIFSERKDYPFPVGSLKPHLLSILRLFKKSW
jgi:hypothetical protein